MSLVADLGAGERDVGDGPLSAISDGLAEAKQRQRRSLVRRFPDEEPNSTRRVRASRTIGQAEFDGGLPAWAARRRLSLGRSSPPLLFLGAARRLRTPAEVER